jgi:hypothetical protein
MFLFACPIIPTHETKLIGTVSLIKVTLYLQKEQIPYCILELRFSALLFNLIQWVSSRHVTQQRIFK